MTTITVDTYALVTKLKEAGIPEQQAALQVETMTKLIDVAVEQVKHDYHLDGIVTNKDLDVRIKETELKIETVRREIAETKADLTRWVIAASAFQITVIAGLILRVTGKL